MLEIINRQRKIKINAADFREVAEKSLSIVEETKGKFVTIAFVSDKKMRELNLDFRQKDSTTDVLSFPYEADEFDFETERNFLGDIIISLEQAKTQALANNLSLEIEVKQLILHGILHLAGYDHETDNGEMNFLELKYRDRIGI